VARALEYLEHALEEAEDAARWYAERSPRAALAFSEEIDAAEAAISRLPDAYPRFDHGTRRYLLRRFPFSVVYRVEANRIVIIAVAHGRREPGYWRQRVPMPAPPSTSG
jgi:plasmid stabilization system protein ParE